MPLAPDVPYDVGDAAFGGYVAGLIDTTRPGSILPDDDYQDGARYMLIVSPKSLETTDSLGGAPGQKTVWDGLSATEAGRHAGQAEQYAWDLPRPADRASRWYVPALDELGLLYRSFKPDTTDNMTGLRPSAVEFPSTRLNHGRNLSMVPTGGAHTTSVPGRTPHTAFREGGPQVLGGNLYYQRRLWSVTNDAQDTYWRQFMDDGDQVRTLHQAVYTVRPVRRILVTDLNIPPDAPTLATPVGGTSYNRLQGQWFSWVFNDPNTWDSQSAYRLRWRPQGATTWTDTGWVNTNTQYHQFPASTFPAGTIEWQASTKDSQGQPGPWSASGFFLAVTPQPGPQILDPANHGTVGSDPHTVKWSVPDQDVWQVQVLDSDVVVHDTGQVASSARQVLVPFPDNNVARTIRLRVQHQGLWSPWSTADVTVDYTPPAVPLVTLDANGTAGTITARLAFLEPAAGEPIVLTYDLWVREVGDIGDGTRLAADQQVRHGPGNTNSWTWWLPASDVHYEFRVQAYGDNTTTVWTAWEG